MGKEEWKWETIHAYRRAVARGEALPIKCPDCYGELVPITNTSGDPSLKCLYCASIFHIGVYVWDQIRKALNEN